jgi:uncharacterized protein YlxW (UPF0749 family)
MKYFNYIVLGLLVIIIFQGFFSVPKGVSEEEVAYRLEVQRLSNEKTELLKVNNELENKIKSFRDEYNKIDSITNSYSNNQIDSFFTEFFNR